MPAEEVGLERVVVGDAWHAIELALIGDRIDRLRRGERGDEMDLIFENEVLGDLCGTVRVGMAILDDEL